MRAYQPYPKYKPSDVEWLGDVPEAWEVTKLKFTATITPSNIDKKSYDDELPISLCNYTDVYYNEAITPDIEFMAATATRDQIQKFSLKQHDVIITKDSEDPNDIAVPSLVSETMPSVVCGYHLTILRPFKSVDGRFLKRYFDSKTTRCHFATRANGLTRYGLGSYPLSNADIALPPRAEQRQIAVFLDRECGKLDTLQAKQARLIELLKEKRQALISHAVTRGLNPAAKLKPSGIERLGDVPGHWRVTRLSFSVNPSTSITYGIVQAGPHVENGVPYIRTGDMSGSSLPDREYPKTSHEIDRSYQRSKVFAGDIVMAIRATVGKALPLPDFLDGANLTQGTAKISPGKHTLRDFLLYSFASGYCQAQFEIHAKGATFKEITLEMLRNLAITLPPLAEQRVIVAHLDEKCGKLDLLKAKAERAIELLKERRSALISAAVTGKIDVRKA